MHFEKKNWKNIETRREISAGESQILNLLFFGYDELLTLIYKTKLVQTGKCQSIANK